MRFLRCGAIAAISLGCFTGGAQASDLTFEERVEAQRAIERVYHERRTGTRRSFEEAVPDALLERKVVEYLQHGRLLERTWGYRLSERALELELERILRDTRDPAGLDQVFAALDRDRFLTLECLVRPTLTARLLRSFFDGDARLHAEGRAEVEALRDGLLSGEISPFVEHPARTEIEYVGIDSRAGDPAPLIPRDDLLRVPLQGAALRHDLGSAPGEVTPIEEDRHGYTLRVQLEPTGRGTRIASYTIPKRDLRAWLTGRIDELGGRPDAAAIATRGVHSEPLRAAPTGFLDPQEIRGTAADSWTATKVGDAPAARVDHTAVWTGNEMIVWGGRGPSGDGAVYLPGTDSWTTLPPTDVLTPRFGHSAVWTGEEMIIWGGSDGLSLASGARYNLSAETWTATSLAGAPEARLGHTAVWTGGDMIIWGGSRGGTPIVAGGRYFPANDSWGAIPIEGSAGARVGHTAIWSGSEMIVWGGNDQTGFLATGARYAPVSNSWTAISINAAPTPRGDHTAVWSGSEMIVWGGRDYGFFLSTGGRYNPATDSWVETPKTGGIAGRADHTAVWSGSAMIVWGGEPLTDTGGLYDPLADTWQATPVGASTPAARADHIAVWTGSEMIVWGGRASGALDSGGRFEPATGQWVPTGPSPATRGEQAPTARTLHSAVWTGNEMIVWGGTNVGPLASGGRWYPITDTWADVSTVSAPSARYAQTAVWSGSEMIVWGGTPLADTGGRYDPGLDTWSPVATAGAPAARTGHSAVWSGSEMIVWGGWDGSYALTGGRYDPSTDSWFPGGTDKEGAPTARMRHSAVWSGSEMIVWGGLPWFPRGSRYDPATDTWRPVAKEGQPSQRTAHTAVWTGTEMIVWGGKDLVALGGGARYDPAFGPEGRWQAVADLDAPGPRFAHTVVWTGSEMIVWGGFADRFFDSGGRYSPTDPVDPNNLQGVWTPGGTSRASAPSPRGGHSAVWNGTHMVVWGGSGAAIFNTGGAYDPVGAVPGPKGASRDAARRSRPGLRRALTQQVEQP